MKEKKVKLKDITQDPELVKLRTVNPVFVSRYRQAYRHGANMPLIIVDGKNNIVSGNHRYDAMLQEFGKDHEITVSVKSFKSNKKRLEFFASENSKHGNPLDGISKKRIALALMKTGASVEEVASLFDVATKKVEAWGDNCVLVTFGGNKKPELAPVKRGLEIESGQVSEKDYKEHLRVDRGISPDSLVNQLCRWLRNGWVSKTEKNTVLLHDLKQAIVTWEKKEEQKEREAS